MVKIITRPVHDHGSILPLSGHPALLLVLFDLAGDHLHLPDRGLNMLDIFNYDSLVFFQLYLYGSNRFSKEVKSRLMIGCHYLDDTKFEESVAVNRKYLIFQVLRINF